MTINDMVLIKEKKSCDWTYIISTYYTYYRYYSHYTYFCA